MFLVSILFSEAVFNLSFYKKVNCKQYFINYSFIEKAIVRKGENLNFINFCIKISLPLLMVIKDPGSKHYLW